MKPRYKIKDKTSYKITDTEQSVMEVLWGHPEAVQTRELLELMKEKGKDWRRQTLNTMLFRLEEKGIVSRTRAYAAPAMSREELRRAQAWEILEERYGGKPGNFFAALAGKSGMTAEDAGRLEAFLEEVKNR